MMQTTVKTAAPMDLDPAVRELAVDSGKDLCVCQSCGTFHFNSDARCPECDAGIYYQCWTTKGDEPAASHEHYAKAYDSKAARLRQQAESCAARAALHRAAHDQATGRAA